VHRLTALMEINNEANKALLRTSHKVRRPENADVQQMSGGPQNPNARAEE